jgi:HEAT repeat protein
MFFFKPNVERMMRKRDVEGLIKALKYAEKDGDSKIWIDAANALGEIGDFRAVEPLFSTFKEVVDKLAKQRMQYVDYERVLRKTIEDLGERTVTYKQLVGELKKINSLISELDKKERNMNEVIVEVLAKIYALAPESLILLFRDKNRDALFRIVAARALGKIGDSRAVEPLISALSMEENYSIREAAAEALGEFKDQRAIEALISALRGIYLGAGWAWVAKNALEKIGPSVAKHLIFAPKHNDWRICKAAAEILDKFSWKPANDEEAAWYWATKGEWKKCIDLGPVAVEPLNYALISALKSKDWNMRTAAVKMLDELNWKPTQQEDVVWYCIAKKDWEKCVTLGAVAVEPLISVLKEIETEQNWVDVRDAHKGAAWALGKLRDPRAVESLISMLFSKHEEVGMTAAEALGEIGDPRAARPLVRRLLERYYYYDFRDTIVGALRKIRHEETARAIIDPLLKGMRIPPVVDQRTQYEKFETIRRAAETILVDIGDPVIGPLLEALRNEKKSQDPFDYVDHAYAIIRDILKKLGYEPTHGGNTDK